ncbi:hypothetical protein PACTADRAFT_52988 [Pachysolen tannophilus NRRL Y-2460]|uniref:Uncharacterized protein n=1 Tax=Pachysolen tannophilus NRRL Y-2460 TaxID=669874 RepID=A0A1E4U1K9_PACTA|nr:hypothetical protein PACTADRAFT_52988 [Pachysolen tannophilus NRRL Y-2460]
MNIYDIDDETNKLLTLDNFLNGLTVPEFIEQLSKDHSLKSGEVNSVEYLDPKPYIRTFESTLTQLKKLSEEGNAKKQKSEAEVSQYEILHSKNVLKIASIVDSMHSKFTSLDEAVTNVSSILSPLGESLQKSVKSKENLSSVVFLVRCYNDFYKNGICEELDELQSSNRQQDNKKCMSTISKLLKFSEKLISNDLTNSKECHELILKYSENLEKHLLNICEESYKNQDFETLRENSDLLFNFNGGGSVIQLFINQSEIFHQEINDINDNIADYDVWSLFKDIDNHKFECDRKSVELFEFIELSIKTESRAIVKVFDNSIAVLKIFIERIYAQILSNRVALLLNYSLKVSNLTYVRYFYCLYKSIAKLTSDLKDFFATNELDDNNDLAAVLDQSFSDLFTGYKKNYFESEHKSLEEIIYSTVAKFEMINEKLVKDQKLSQRIKKFNKNSGSDNDLELANSINDTATISTNRLSNTILEKSKLSSLSHFINSHLERSSSTKEHQKVIRSKILNEPITNTGNNYNIQMDFDKVDRMIMATGESILRILEITPAKSSEYFLRILEIVIVGIGKSYIDVALEVSYNVGIIQQDYKNSNYLNFQYLNVINQTNEILSVISSMVKSVILPLIVNSPQIKNRLIALMNGYLTRCELAITFIMKDTLQLISNKIAFNLSKQKKKDFLIKNSSDLELIQENTEACEETCLFLNNILSQLLRIFGLKNQNLKKLLIEINFILLNHLLLHLKKFQINENGGLVLTQDIVRYQSVITEFRVGFGDDVDDEFEEFNVLREIANLFTVQKELLPSLMKEGRLAKLKPYVVKQYIMKRSDYAK